MTRFRRINLRTDVATPFTLLAAMVIGLYLGIEIVWPKSADPTVTVYEPVWMQH
jgi:hypothetical protein